MEIPARYRARRLDDDARTGWLGWSLEFFTDPEVLQVPYVDITLQLDVEEAYGRYRRQAPPGGSFFAFLVWHLVQAFKGHPSFLLRQIEGHWYLVENPPVLIPIAVGGRQRFSELILEDVADLDLTGFSARYREQLELARRGEGQRASPQDFYLGHFFGNLPNLQFTGLTLHYRRESIAGQSLFYFGRRYCSDGRTHIPLAAKLHHACTDPFVLDLLLQELMARMRD